MSYDLCSIFLQKFEVFYDVGDWWFFTRDRSVRMHPRSHHLVPGLHLEQTPKTNFWTPLRGFALLTVCSVPPSLILLFPLFPHILYFSVSAILLLSLCSTYHMTDSGATHLLYVPLVFPSCIADTLQHRLYTYSDRTGEPERRRQSRVDTNDRESWRKSTPKPDPSRNTRNAPNEAPP